MGEGIRVDGVSKTYPSFAGRRHEALSEVTFAIARGEVFGLIGPNGAGKTTLMGCLLGHLDPTEGKVSVLGFPPDDLSVRRLTGYLPERVGFAPDVKGIDFLTGQARLAGLRGEPLSRAVQDVLERVQLPAVAMERRLGTYSRGMRQRIGLAQALVGSPTLLFLDEPTSGLDPTGVALVRDVINDARLEGVTVILNSHNLQEVGRVCDRVAFLDRGRVRRIETLRAGDREAAAWTLRVASGHEERGVMALTGAGFTVRSVSAQTLAVSGPQSIAGAIAPALVSHRVTLLALADGGDALERLFERERHDA
jgi:ABC-2 type transport system ATP-binding protein